MSLGSFGTKKQSVAGLSCVFVIRNSFITGKLSKYLLICVANAT